MKYAEGITSWRADCFYLFIMKNAFTLIELLITISIFSILIVMPLFGLNSILKSAALIGAANQVTSKLDMVRGNAISSSTLTELNCSSQTYRIRKLNISTNAFDEINTETLPYGIVFDKNISFRFASTGFPQPGYTGTAILKDSRGHEKKIVVSSVGRIRIE